MKALKIILIVVCSLIMIVFLFLTFYKPFGGKVSKSSEEDYAKRSEYYSNGVFSAYEPFDLMDDSAGPYTENDKSKPTGEIPVKKIDSIDNAKSNELRYTWFGHSSGLLQISGLNILIDPVLSDYATPLAPFGPKRIAEVPIESENLPNIDIVLISHDHYDHLDYNTIKAIDSKVKKYIVPLGVENHLIEFGIDKDKIVNIAWWENVESDNVNIISTPGNHYSGRIPWRNNRTLWSGYIIQNNDYKVYYTGDTGYGSFFKDINNRYGSMDLVLIEDGQYNSMWPGCHLSPSEGMQALNDLDAKNAIPVHWAGFVMSNHDWNAPATEYLKLSQNENVNIVIPYIGQTVDYNDLSSVTDTWWEDVD